MRIVGESPEYGLFPGTGSGIGIMQCMDTLDKFRVCMKIPDVTMVFVLITYLLTCIIIYLFIYLFK